MTTEEIEEARKTHNIGAVWSLKGKLLTGCGMRYRLANEREKMQGRIVWWIDKKTLEIDERRFAFSKHATKQHRSKFITDEE